MGTNRHFKRRTEDLNVLATAALAGVKVESVIGASTTIWRVIMPGGYVFLAQTKLQGAKAALERLENA